MSNMKLLSRRLARARMVPAFRRRITGEQWWAVPSEVEKVGPYDFDALPEWLRTAVIEAEAEMASGAIHPNELSGDAKSSWHPER
jgi:hypothetical protein